MILIDQHAHERILYERLIEARKQSAADDAHQQLLVPVPVQVTSLEMSELEEVREQILNLGFEFEAFEMTLSSSVVFRQAAASVWIRRKRFKRLSTL